MLFALICKDKAGALDTRLSVRPDHVTYLDGLNAAGQLKLAGPFLDDDGKPCGSLLILEADDLAGAQALAAGDPYAKAGIFETVELRPWNWTFNRPEGA
jgi:uncharacterized protein